MSESAGESSTAGSRSDVDFLPLLFKEPYQDAEEADFSTASALSGLSDL